MKSNRRALGLIALVFVGSRAAAYLAGVRFDASPLDYFIQYPDPTLLKTDMLSTVWYFHMAPPLSTLFFGLVLNIFGSSFSTIFAAVYFTFGLALALWLYALMTALGGSQLVSVVLTIGFALSPAAILYENWLYPDYLIAALLVAAALLLRDFAASGHTLKAAGFCALLGLIVLSRSYYQVAWFVVCVGAVLLVIPFRKRLAVAALIPLVLVLALYARNYEMWGFFSGSSSTGLNFYNEFIVQLPVSDRARLAAEGRVSNVAVQSDVYLAHPEAYGLRPPTGIPVLDQTYKTTGVVNYGNRTYVDIWGQLQSDGIAVIEARPVVLERAGVMALFIFFVPSQDYPLEPQNRARLLQFERLSNVLESGQIRDVAAAPRDPVLYQRAHWTERLAEVGWLTLLVYVLAIPYGVLRTWRAVRNHNRALAAPLIFLLVTIVYVGVSDLVAGIPDNNRYRFMIDPLVLALLAALLARAGERWRIKPLAARSSALS